MVSPPTPESNTPIAIDYCRLGRDGLSEVRGLRDEGSFILRACASERGVAMRKSAEALDDGAMGLRRFERLLERHALILGSLLGKPVVCSDRFLLRCRGFGVLQ